MAHRRILRAASAKHMTFLSKLQEALADGKVNPGRIYGPRVIPRKNIGRHYGILWSQPKLVWMKNREGQKQQVKRSEPIAMKNSRYVPHQGEREKRRRRGQLASRASNA